MDQHGQYDYQAVTKFAKGVDLQQCDMVRTGLGAWRAPQPSLLILTLARICGVPMLCRC